MRGGVSTSPAPTARGGRPSTRPPAGAVTRTARDTPPLVGTSSGRSVRTTNSTAERATASGQFTLPRADRKSTRLNSSHLVISYAVFCLKKKKKRCPPQYHLIKRCLRISLSENTLRQLP